MKGRDGFMQDGASQPAPQPPFWGALASAGGADVIDGAIASDGEQPWPNRAFLGVEALHAVPDAEESLLHQVFGDAGVAHNAKNQGEHDAAVAVVEFGERLRFATLQSNDECSVRLRATKR